MFPFVIKYFLSLSTIDIMATIGFTQPSYSVVEGQVSVTVEVGLLSGTIPPNNEVIVSFSTANQDAIGTSLLPLNMCFPYVYLIACT